MARWGWVDIIRGFRYGDGSRIYLFIYLFGGGFLVCRSMKLMRIPVGILSSLHISVSWSLCGTSSSVVI